MMTPAQRRATYADLEPAPEHLIAEIVDGDLVTSPRPAIAHSHSTSVLGMDLGGAFQRGRGGPGGWRQERMPSPPAKVFRRVDMQWVWVAAHAAR